jgi:hypothetical protein
MRHVDDGTIHAWLDEQITDPGEAAWIHEHLGECATCRARLTAEGATVDRAQALLAEGAPSGERPSFEALVAKAGHAIADAERPDARVTRGRRERLFFQAAWAASLALAVGLGWAARDLTGRDRFDSFPAATVTAPQPDTLSAPAPRVDASDPATTPAIGAEVSSVPRRDAAARQRPEASRSIGGAAPTTPQQATPAAQRQAAPQMPASLQRSAADTRGEPPASAQDSARSSVAETTRADAPPPTTAAPAAAALQETISLGADVAAAASRATEWRPLPRTEAAARTGMPLYGIDGLEPVLTALSGDGARVRTTYRLASGDVVELVQQRPVPGAPQVGADSLAIRPLAPIEVTRRATARAEAGTMLKLPSPRRTWTSVRGDVRITLTSDAADLNALGAKLRVD